jgi:hypothetical protein
MFEDADYTERQMNEVVGRLRADLEYWRSQGVRITAFGPEFNGEGVGVATTEVELARRHLRPHCGMTFVIQYGGPWLPAIGATDRLRLQGPQSDQ